MKSWIAAWLLALAPAVAGAVTPEEIMDKAREARRVSSAVQSVRMVLVAKSGSERVRELELKMKREGDVIKSYMRFSSPADVAGTSMVQVDHPDQVDEQLLYLPALKRVTRISGKARKGQFVGSDFAYEDLELSASSGEQHTLAEETDTTWVIDTNPGDDSSYGRIRSHVAKEDYLARKVEFFDEDGVAIKVLEVSKTEKDGNIVLATMSEMHTLKKGTRTRLEVVEHRLDVPAEDVPDELFTKAYLERGG